MSTVAIIKKEIRLIKRGEDNLLKHYKYLVIATIGATKDDVKNIQDWIKNEYPSSWGKKLSALIGGAHKYAKNIPLEEVDKVSTLSGLMQLVRIAKTRPATAADAEAREKNQRSGGGRGKNNPGENSENSPRSQSDPLAADLAVAIGKMSSSKTELVNQICQLSGELVELAEKENSAAKLKNVLALLMRAEKILKA